MSYYLLNMLGLTSILYKQKTNIHPINSIPHLNPLLTESQSYALFGRDNGFFDRHTLGKPLIERVSMDSKSFGYLCDCKLFAVNLIDAIASKVILLLLACRPSAIARFIVLIPINAINSHSFWALTHIYKKILERIKPSIAYHNTTSAIVTEKLTFGVMTPLLHAAPRLVGVAARKPGFCISLMHIVRTLRGALAMKAPARLARALNKMVAPNGFNFSAIALANPRSPLGGKVALQNKKSCESFVSQINNIGHKVISLCLTLYHNNAIKQGGF